MESSLNSLLLKCNKLLRTKCIPPQDWDGLSREIDIIQSFDQGMLALLSPCTSCLRATFKAILELLRSSKSDPYGIVQKLLSLLISFCCANGAIKELLVTEYQLVSTLVTLLPSLEESSVIVCLQLLETLSYGIKEFTSSNGKECELLLKYCTTVVLSGVNSNSQLLLCLELVINICMNNLSAQAWLKGLPNYDSLQQKMMSFLSNKNISLIVTTLHLLAVLSLKDTLGNKIFKPCNIDQTLQLALSIICTSFDYNTMKQAVDLLIFLLSSSQDFQRSLSQYPQFEICIQKGFRRLTEVDGDLATKILELYTSFLNLSSDLSNFLINILINTKKKITSSLKCLLELLQEERLTFTLAIIAGMKLLNFLLQSPKYLSMLAEVTAIEETIFSSVVKCFCTIGDFGWSEEYLYINFKKQKQALLVLFLCSHSKDSTKAVTVLFQTLQFQLQHNPAISGQGHKTCIWSSLGLSVGIGALYVITLCSQSGALCIETKFDSLVKDNRVLSLISCALHGKDKSDISMALSVIIHFQNSGAHFSLIEGLSEMHAFSNELLVHEPLLSPEDNLSQQSDLFVIGTRDCHETKQLEEIIDKFKSCVEVQDVRASEIMNVYEHKLQSMMSKENHLQDLLDAKSQAMSQADRLLKQYRMKMTNYDTECQKLRSLLQVVEKEREDLKDKIFCSKQTEKELSLKISELEAEIMQLKCVMEEFHELKEDHHKQTQRLEDVAIKMNDLEKEKNKLHCCVTSLETHQIELQKLITEKEKEVVDVSNHYKTCLQNLQTKYQESKEDLKEKGEQLQAMTDLKMNFEKEIYQLTQALDSAQREIQLLSQKGKEYENYTIQLEKQLSNMKQRESDLQDQVCTLKLDSDLFSAVKTLINEGQNGAS